MEAAPRLPMISFELLTSQESVQYARKLKPYIAGFYNEDPDSYTAEIDKLDALRASATHPSTDLAGLQALKKYYCQLHFLKSRFPMNHGEVCFVEFEWKDCQNGTASGGVTFELMAVLYNIGVLHSILGAEDSRSNPEGMKLACSHFQCAVWAFQTLREKYPDAVAYITSPDVPYFYKQVCLAQAQECVLEKSMLDNRKSTIISKVAVQVWDYYRQAIICLKGINEDVVGRSRYKDWVKYLEFKIAYHRCISLLFQGQQAEELQKMGERLAFYQAACDSLQEASKYLSSKQQKELADALAFTTDVVEGKRKAAKNENEYIYHEVVPDIANLQEVKGASLVKGIEFDVNDPEVSGPDIFQRLVPMEAHEAASVYSEKKAEVLRNMGQRLEVKDQSLVEFMSSMQLDLLTKMHQASGIPQELIDRAAALSAKPSAIQDLVDAMARLSNIYHDVEANLSEIDILLKEEEENEKSYQEVMGKRPPSIITTDLAREAFKYKEAHTKAKESNDTLSKAMMTHLENLKILQRPIRELQQRLPSIELPDPKIDQNSLKELEMLNSKVDEMKSQRAMLWAQLRDAIHNDDITNALITKQPHQPIEEVFKFQLHKHSQLIDVLDKNLAAQDNIKKAFVDCYANTVSTRRYIQDIIQKRSSTIQALIASHDSYDDLLAKAMKGVEFYTKLEVNVSKLLQRIKSASKVQQEEREQMLAKNTAPKKDDFIAAPVSSAASAPKLKDYLEARKKAGSMAGYSSLNYGANVSETSNWPPGVRPAPVGSEINTDPTTRLTNEAAASVAYYQQHQQPFYQNFVQPNLSDVKAENDITQLTNRMGSLLGKQLPMPAQYSYPASSYTPQNYTPTSYNYPSQYYSEPQEVQSPVSGQDSSGSKAFTTTTNSYNTITSYMPDASQDNEENVSFNNKYSQGQQQPQYYQYQYSQGQTQQQYPQNQVQQYPPSDSQHQYSVSSPAVHYPQSQTPQPQQYGSVQQVQTIDYTTPGLSYGSATKDALQYGKPAVGQGQVPDSRHGTVVSQEPAGNLHGTAATVIAGSNNYYDTSSGQTTVPQFQITDYSLQQQGAASHQYFPQGYAPNYVNPLNVSSQNTYGVDSYHPQYYTQQHASSVASTTPYTNNYSTYSSPSSVPYSFHSDSTGGYQSKPVSHVPTSTTASSGSTTYYSYGSVYGYDQGSYAPTTTASYTYPTSTPQAVNTAHVATQKESNVDLLTGLDFSASSNIPTLTPQQNLPPQDAVQETETKKQSVIEIKPPKPSPSEANRPKQEVVRVLPSKPLNNADVKALFNQELEKFEKYVDTLTTKTLSGPTTLEVKWKEIQDTQEPSDSVQRTISVARCYPMKNRFPDILPYDYSRVELKSTNDDYINASFVKQISPFGPHFIVTQAPFSTTVGDFWAMVREQQIELIFCLLNDNEMGGDVYWPKEKGQHMTILNQNMMLSLQSVIVKPHWVERLICLTAPEKKESWMVMHLQFTSWPGSLFPTSPEPFLSLVLELITLFQQQKSPAHPILIHCAAGIGRSGLLCLLSNAILEVTNQANTIPDLAAMASKLGHFRKNILRDREHLKFAYEALVCYIKQLLAQDGLRKKLNEVVTHADNEESVPAATEVQEPIVDPLSTLDPFWASKK